MIPPTKGAVKRLHSWSLTPKTVSVSESEVLIRKWQFRRSDVVSSHSSVHLPAVVYSIERNPTPSCRVIPGAWCASCRGILRRGDSGTELLSDGDLLPWTTPARHWRAARGGGTDGRRRHDRRRRRAH